MIKMSRAKNYFVKYIVETITLLARDFLVAS